MKYPRLCLLFLLSGLLLLAGCRGEAYSPEEKHMRTFYGTAVADIDGDGRQEECWLGMGRTSGVFTFTLTVLRKGRPVSENTYLTGFYTLSFLQEEGLRIQGITRDNPPRRDIFLLVPGENGMDLVNTATGEVLERLTK